MPTVGNIRRDPLQVDIGEIMALTSHVEATRCSAYFTERVRFTLALPRCCLPFPLTNNA